jgi:hypothetical protein
MLSSANPSPKPFTQFTEEQWDAIRAVRRKWPDDIDWLKVRRALEEAGRQFAEVTAQREGRRRSKEYREFLRGAQWHLGGLQDRLSRLEMLSPSGRDLDGMPDPGLEWLEERLEQLSAEYERWSVPYAGKRNWIRETLENRLLDIWEGQLHGRVRSSKTADQEPAGPLLRFLRVTLTAIIGTSPRAWGLESIVDKAKKRRRPSQKNRTAHRSKIARS